MKTPRTIIDEMREAMTTIQKLIKLHGDNEPQFALTLIAEVVYAALADLATKE